MTQRTQEQVDNLRSLVVALRSGEYAQGRGSLRTLDHFCCLGVGCDIVKDQVGGEWHLDNSFRTPGTYDRVGLPPPSVLERYGLWLDQASQLASMNDTGASFHEIADFIEREYVECDG